MKGTVVVPQTKQQGFHRVSFGGVMYSHGPNLSLSRIFSFGHAKAPSSETRALRFPKKSCPWGPFRWGTPVEKQSRTTWDGFAGIF